MSQTVPTSVDVARAAGVAQVTVSRALTGQPYVAETTRKRVIEAAQRLGYRPNHLASGLGGASTRSIALVWPINTLIGDAEIGAMVLRDARHKGFATYQAETDEQTIDTLDGLLRRRVDGLIFHWNPLWVGQPSLVERINAFRAAVVVGPWKQDGLAADQVVHDRTEAIQAAVDHFSAVGRRRPAFAIPGNETNRYKYPVFLERCRQRGLGGDPSQIIEVRKTQPGSYAQDYEAALAHYLDSHSMPDALLCGIDQGAAAVMRLIQKRGLRVPDDVAVIGFNDTDFAPLLQPELASVDRCNAAIASALEKLLFSRLEASDLPSRTEHVPMKLILRESAGRVAPSYTGDALNEGAATTEGD